MEHQQHHIDAETWARQNSPQNEDESHFSIGTSPASWPCSPEQQMWNMGRGDYPVTSPYEMPSTPYSPVATSFPQYTMSYHQVVAGGVAPPPFPMQAPTAYGWVPPPGSDEYGYDATAAGYIPTSYMGDGIDSSVASPEMQGPDGVIAVAAAAGVTKVLTQREKNRLAAHRCRRKLKEVETELKRREKDLVLENRKLTAAKEDAKRELLELKVAMLRQGRCNCGYVRDYIHKCAQNVS